MGVEINGIAHIQLTVNDPARCVPFWEQLCHFMGMRTLIRADEIVYCIGGRTGILVRGAAPAKASRPSAPSPSQPAAEAAAAPAKVTTHFFGTSTLSPVRGLRAVRGPRSFTSKIPKPRNSTRPPVASSVMIASKVI